MDLVLLAAGASSRYPTEEPKFWLTMPDGRRMIEHAIDAFADQVDLVHVVILHEHNDRYKIVDELGKKYKNLKLSVLMSMMNGPARTAALALAPLTDRPVFIKDCDSIFTATLPVGNFVCVDAGHRDPANSYVKVINDGIADIVEKTCISDIACVGGYGFASSAEFVNAVVELQSDSELYCSQVIKHMLPRLFTAVAVDDYVDLGTYEKFLAHTV